MDAHRRQPEVRDRAADAGAADARPVGGTVCSRFIIQRGGQWLRLVPDPAGALYRGPLRPPATSHWLPINGNLRFAVEQQAPERDAGAGQLPSVLGYFVGRHDGHWLRLGSSA
jgi:hypothetical protein